MWRSGQVRRLAMIREWVDLANGRILDSGCGLGAYLNAFAPYSNLRFGHDVEHERLVAAIPRASGIVQSVGEDLPFATGSFDFVFSNEVIEHVVDDAQYAAEMVRVTKDKRPSPHFLPQSLVSRGATRHLLARPVQIWQHPSGQLPAQPPAQSAGSPCTNLLKSKLAATVSAFARAHCTLRPYLWWL